jgi:leucyl aminopeptidase
VEIVLRRGNLATRAAGALALGIFEGEARLGGAAADVDRASGGAIRALLKTGDFAGRWLESVVLYPSRGKAKRVLLVGLGPRAAFDARRARQTAAVAARRARDLGARVLALVAHGAGGTLDPGAAGEAAAEGALLGHYRHTAYRADAGAPALVRVEILERDATRFASMREAVERGVRIGEGVCLARDLAATPGQDLTPENLADRAREVARASGARATVLGVPQMERLGMGAVLGVGRGSEHAPRFIVLERGAARAKERPIVVIGKGITFDTGGISLKPRENMHKMKYDMSGAAAVLGLFHALPALDLARPVIGLIPSAENMPGGRALKPGDVLRALDGTTIEVTNTDAEGRLVLADALGYARRFRPAAVVDLATLTGAVSIALGHLAAGLFSEDDALAGELLAAGEASGERLWRLPLWDGYAAEMRSDTADLVNSAAREGGAILGAVFLRHFARGMRWAHLDIASTAWAPSDRPLERRGPTGFGVRLLCEWLSREATARTAASSARPRGARARAAGRTRAARA